MLFSIQDLFSIVSFLPELFLFAANRPSNKVIALIMIAVFIAAAVCSAIVTHKLRQSKASKNSESSPSVYKNDSE